MGGNKASDLFDKFTGQLSGILYGAELLGVSTRSHELLGEMKSCHSNEELLGEIKSCPSNLNNSPSKNLSPSKMRRKGEGSGNIHWRLIAKNGKDYSQAYYHYEFWSSGEREIKSTKYIPKRLLSQVLSLDSSKAPVRKILEVLGVVE